MSKVLTELLEQRDAAQKEFDTFVAEVRDGKSTLTDEQRDAKRAELRTNIDALDSRIDEEDEKEQRNTKISEIRGRLGTLPNLQVTEPTTYGKGSENSYFLDLVRASNPVADGADAARERLLRASHEAAVEMMSSPKEEVREQIRTMIKEQHRNTGKDEVREALKRYEALGTTGRGELRSGMDTTSGSGGSFATPVYFVQKYAPWREAGRAFADQCNAQDLPPYGMTVYIPHVTGPASVAAQVSENSGISETAPTAGYLSAPLATLAGEVPVSQQLLDRAGPGFPFDKMVFDQLERDYAPKLDQYALTAALANAGTVTYTDSSGFTLVARSTPGVGGFYGKVSAAKSAIRTTAGTIMNPTHLFMQPERFEYISGWADNNGRPVLVPDYAGPFNAVAAGSASGDAGVEGATGYKLNGLPVFQDLNIPAPGSGNDQAVVGALDEVYLFEGTPVPRVIPQTLAQNLSVLIQMYSYVAVLVRYPSAIQAISGSGMASISF